jgi:PTH1 family peptidyl-tRNA hydrolase
VRAILDFYKLTVADVLVICDDINLPIGKLRARAGGSAGGQNGLKNIQEQLGTDQYARLRIGVGQPAPGEAVDYVLGRFKPGERPAIEDAVAKAAQAAIVWVRNGIEACANLANGPGDQDKKPKKPRPVKENKEPVEPKKTHAEPD